MIGNAAAGIINMMTEAEFWDKFNRKHNPKYYYATKNKKKTKEEKTESKEESCRAEPAKRYPFSIGTCRVD